MRNVGQRMTDTEIKNGIKKTFDEVAPRYEKIDFFKLSAKNISDLIYNKNAMDILDVASGTGNVVLECASCLKDANLDAVDISPQMLECAKQKAKEQNINNVNFHCCDIESLDMQKLYDVVTCSYALFFLPNPIDTLKKIYSHLKPNGTLIFTSFTEDAFSPSSKILMELLNSYGVETPPKSWKNLQTQDDISYLCNQAEIEDFSIETKAIRYGMSLDEWWALNNDAGYRGFLLQLSEDDYESVKKKYFKAMQEHKNDSELVELIADTFYTIVKKTKV